MEEQVLMLGPYARAFARIGEFMFYWAALEGELNRSVRLLLGLKGLEGTIATANIQVRDKIHITRTTLNLWVDDDDLRVRANRVLNQIGNMAGDRNTVAHNMFGPKGEGAVKFILVKAKGELKFPETVWTGDDFRAKRDAMTAAQDELEKVVAEVIRNKQPQPAKNALLALVRSVAGPTTDSDEPAQRHPPVPPAPEPPGSPPASPEKAPRKPEAPQPKPKGQRGKK